MLNLERFRNVNETLGQHAGDELLRHAAQRLNGALVETDILARVGADSFAIVTRCTDDDGTVVHVLKRVLSCLHGQPFEVAGNELRVVAKAGVAMFPANGEDADTLSRNAGQRWRKPSVPATGICSIRPRSACPMNIRPGNCSRRSLPAK